ncbi:hypothetical protein GEMRC1_004868 [Eukaryota sp. GEM-RC1]
MWLLIVFILVALSLAIIYQKFLGSISIFESFSVTSHIVSFLVFLLAFYTIYFLSLSVFALAFAIPPQFLHVYYSPSFSFTSSSGWLSVCSLFFSLLTSSISFIALFRPSFVTFDFFISLSFCHVIMLTVIYEIPSTFVFYLVLLLGFFAGWFVSELLTLNLNLLSYKPFSSVEKEVTRDSTEMDVVIDLSDSD